MWASLKRCYKETYNLQNHRNEWANLKQYALNEDYHTFSLIPLSEYLNTFQGYLDSLSNTPSEPTELEIAITLLAGVDDHPPPQMMWGSSRSTASQQAYE